MPGRVVGGLAVADTLRQDAKAMVAGLKRAGMAKIMLLTGDNAQTAAAMAAAVGIAAVGLLAKLASAWILWRNSDIQGNSNIRSAYLHIVGDALGSNGAIVAGLLMLRYSCGMLQIRS